MVGGLRGMWGGCVRGGWGRGGGRGFVWGGPGGGRKGVVAGSLGWEVLEFCEWAVL